MKNKTWRLWCYSLGAKSGKNDKEANVVSSIRTFIFITYLITNSFIIAGVIQHWNDKFYEVPSSLSQAKKEGLLKANRNFAYD